MIWFQFCSSTITPTLSANLRPCTHPSVLQRQHRQYKCREGEAILRHLHLRHLHLLYILTAVYRRLFLPLISVSLHYCAKLCLCRAASSSGHSLITGLITNEQEDGMSDRKYWRTDQCQCHTVHWTVRGGNSGLQSNRPGSRNLIVESFTQNCQN